MAIAIATVVDGLFEPDYGYNIEMHVDEKDITVLCSTVYNGLYFKTVRQFDVLESEYIEATIFNAVYDCLRETQRKCERLHEGC